MSTEDRKDDDVTEELSKEVVRLKKRLNRSLALNEELEALFELQHKRSVEASARWCKDAGKDGVLPDLGKLLTYLLAKADIADEVLALSKGGVLKELDFTEGVEKLFGKVKAYRELLEEHKK